jgi:glucuronoarabinoxylan endo-1,4-beta-xylanase
VHKFHCAVSLVLTLGLAACGGGSSSTSQPPVTPPPSTPVTGTTATIDFGNTHQVIRGFGGSTAWMPAMPSAEVNALFGTGANQIGLSILRVRIDPSSVTGGSNWDTEVTNAQEAIAAGSNVSVIATPWTPPASMKSNNNVVMGSLNPSNYAAYATYLESFVGYMANHGVNLYGISMQNEPDANVTYESCVWTPAQMDAWAANNAQILTTKLIMPESQNFLASYADPAMNDPLAAANISIIGGHIYGVSPAPYPAAANMGKELWMTEHFLDPAGTQPAIGDAVRTAKEIHDSLTVANYNAYLWWWVADWNPGNGITNTGLVDTANTPTYFGWAVAQFSRFIRPGYIRVDASYSTSNVYVSAYKGNGHFVIVAVNTGTSDVSQPFAIQNQTISSLTPYQTTATAHVAQQPAVSVSNSQFTYTLPAQSITTFVQ